MGLFSEREKNVEENYIRLLDILEVLYQLSDNGWEEVGHFLFQSDIDSICTYEYFDDYTSEIRECEKIIIEHVYEHDSGWGTLKQALIPFIFNNCDSLDGEHLENKIIAGIELEKRFGQYYWSKEDVKNFDKFKRLNLIEILESGRPLKKKKNKIGITEAINQESKKYIELIWCIQSFCESFNQPIQSFVKFLKNTKFYSHCDVYIRVGETEFIKLNKINSDQSISFVLDFFDNEKFNSTDFGYDVDYYHLNHILIDEDDLRYFEPLKDLIVDVKIRHALYTDIRYGDIKLDQLDDFSRYIGQESDKLFDAHWKKIQNPNTEKEDIILLDQTNLKTHPSLDPNHPNHAPELLIAIEAWEEKYLCNQYPYQEHTPAITNILKNRDITQTNLVKRICAITNPKK